MFPSADTSACSPLPSGGYRGRSLRKPCGSPPSQVSGRRRRACALASVRRSNCTYSFPVCSFYEDSSTAGCKRRNQPHQVHKLILTVQRRCRQLFPTAIAPTFKPMRPDPPHDPTVELIEELSDVGSFVMLAPPPQERVKSRNQLLGFQRDPPFGALPYVVLETLDRLLTRVRVERTERAWLRILLSGKCSFFPRLIL